MLKNYIPTALLQITQVLQDVFFSYHVLGWRIRRGFRKLQKKNTKLPNWF